jgi:hypothetical protein
MKSEALLDNPNYLSMIVAALTNTELEEKVSYYDTCNYCYIHKYECAQKLGESPEALNALVRVAGSAHLNSIAEILHSDFERYRSKAYVQELLKERDKDFVQHFEAMDLQNKQYVQTLKNACGSVKQASSFEKPGDRALLASVLGDIIKQSPRYCQGGISLLKYPELLAGVVAEHIPHGHDLCVKKYSEAIKKFGLVPAVGALVRVAGPAYAKEVVSSLPEKIFPAHYEFFFNSLYSQVIFKLSRV